MWYPYWMKSIFNYLTSMFYFILLAFNVINHFLLLIFNIIIYSAYSSILTFNSVIYNKYSILLVFNSVIYNTRSILQVFNSANSIVFINDHIWVICFNVLL